MNKCGSLLAVLAMSIAAEAQAQVPVATAPAKEQAILVQSKDSQLAHNKKVVFDYWRIVMQAGRVDKVPDYVDAQYTSHDSTVAPGRQGLIDSLSPRLKKRSVRASLSNLVNIIADDDLVMLETLNVIDDPNDAEVQYKSVDYDVFRLREGRIVEQWASPRMTAELIIAARTQARRPPSAPTGGAAPPSKQTGAQTSSGAVPLEDQTKLLTDSDPQVAKNKQIAFDYWRIVIESGRFDLAPQYMAADYIQHNPGIPSGRQALIDFLSPRRKPNPTISPGIAGLMHVIAERDIVALMQANRGDVGFVVFDVLRVENGKIAEHWDSARFAADVAMTRRGQPGIQPAVPPPTPAQMGIGGSAAPTGPGGPAPN